MPDWGSNQVSGYGDSNIEGTDWQGEGQGNWFSQQNYGQGITTGLAAGASSSQPVGDFEIDPYAGFTGSVKGLSGGPVGAILGGITGQIGQFSSVNKAVRNLDTSVNGVSYDAYGRPVYNSQNVVNAQQNIDALRRGEKAITGAVDPGTQIFGAMAGTRGRIRRKRRALQANMKQTQTDFNTAELNFRNQNNQRQSYLDRLNDNSRYLNLYRYRS